MTDGAPRVGKHDWTGRLLEGRYRIERVLGAGGMGTVYLARDERMERPVVVKVPHARLLDDEEFRARFAKEIRALTTLSHPHIVKVLDAGETASEGGGAPTPFAVLEFLDGGSLKDRLDAGGVQRVDRVLAWLRDVAKALDFIHAQGVVHRDVKPGNILFDRAGNAFLADFGIAKAMGTIESGLTRTGFTPGSPSYMGPEVGLGVALGPAYDEYALGVLVYEALSGALPHEGTSGEVLIAKKAYIEPMDLGAKAPSVPAAARDVVMRALARKPESRFPSCVAFVEALAAQARAPAAPMSAESARKAAPVTLVEPVRASSLGGVSVVARRGTRARSPAPGDDDSSVAERVAECEGLLSREPEDWGALSLGTRFKYVGVSLFIPPVFTIWYWRRRSPVRDRVRRTRDRFQAALDEVRRASASSPDLRPTVAALERRHAEQRKSIEKSNLRSLLLAFGLCLGPILFSAISAAVRFGWGDHDNADLVGQVSRLLVRGDPAGARAAALRIEDPWRRAEALQQISLWERAVPPSPVGLTRTDVTPPARDGNSPPTPDVVVTALSGWAAAEGTEKDAATGHPKRIKRTKDGGEMVLIPAGTFQMGAVPGDTKAQADERPRHAVTLSKAYYLDVNEVTNEQFEKFVSATSHRTTAEEEGDGWAGKADGTDWEVTKGVTWRAPLAGGGKPANWGQHPVVLVSHADATAFALWAGAALPTEAQFERAQRGGTDGRVYPWDDRPPVPMGFGNYAGAELKRAYPKWPFEIMSGPGDGFVQTAPVGSFRSNGYGVYDLSGNVSEWCADWSGSTYYGGSPDRDPPGPGSGSAHAVRGGSWSSSVVNLRASYRDNCDPSKRCDFLGFRLARSL